MMGKAKCDYCPATYLGKYTDSDGKTCHKCLAHLPNGIEIDFGRYEHLILNEIKESLPSSQYYNKKEIISPQYDKGLMKGVRQRPDLIIRSPLEGNNIVIVEVDEGYHDKEEQRRLDIEREEFFRKKLTDKAKDDRKPVPTISFVRIEPYDLQDNSIVGKMQKMTISPGKKSKKVFKRGEFEGVLKTSISEIRKKLTRRTLGTSTIKITPDNYGYAYPKVRSPLKSPYSRIFPRRRSTLIDEVNTRSISPPRLPKKPSLSSENTEQMVKDFSKMTHNSKITSYKKKIPDFNKSFKCKYHKNCEVSIDGFHNSKKNISPRKKSLSPFSKAYSPKAYSPKKSPGLFSFLGF
jgi:hypothetical protein